MIAHTYYEEDPRVRREAEALVARGRAVDVIALRRPGDGREGTLNGVRITRIDVQRHQGAGLPVYLTEYISFLLWASWSATRAHRRRHYGVVQVHSLPDFLVFAALPLKLVGVKVILDLHEAMPEFFTTRFPNVRSPLVRRALLLQERLSIAFADRVLSVNELMADRLLALGVRPDKLSIVPNAPDLSLFNPADSAQRGFRQDGPLRIVYTGALTPTYELDVTLAAVARLAAHRPDLDPRLDLYGRGDSESSLRDQAATLGIADRVTFHGRIPLEDVPAAVAAADIGVAPTRLDDFTKVSLSTKIFEYGAMGKPVVASRLPLVERTFGPDTVLTYPSGDDAAMAAAIVRIADDEPGRHGRVERTAARIAKHGWAEEADRYAAIVDRLDRRRARAGRAKIDGLGDESR
ncbi:MAG TPA: glycosyltransferase family 4 protein [Patescibacteria group bacterium]|nr:glycosyltransferase family 4 protein [Patescibacteria group bacterium]